MTTPGDDDNDDNSDNAIEICMICRVEVKSHVKATLSVHVTISCNDLFLEYIGSLN